MSGSAFKDKRGQRPKPGATKQRGKADGKAPGPVKADGRANPRGGGVVEHPNAYWKTPATVIDYK